MKLTLGTAAGAVGDAEQSVTYADRSGDAFSRKTRRARVADALHQAGRRAEAETRFREAEPMQKERRPDYPPTDVPAWQRIYRIMESYGLNHTRFHSWCPPEAAFAAADMEGIMVQADNPRANVSVGSNPARDAFIEAEFKRIVDKGKLALQFVCRVIVDGREHCLKLGADERRSPFNARPTQAVSIPIS